MNQRWLIIGAALAIILSSAVGYISSNRPEASGIGDVNQLLPDPATIRYAKFSAPFKSGTANYDSFTMKSRKSDYGYRWHLISIRGASAQLVEDCSPSASNRNASIDNSNPVRQYGQGLADLKPMSIPDYIFIFGFDAKTQQYVRIQGSTPLEGGRSYTVTSRDPITCLTFRSSGDYTYKNNGALAIKLLKGWNLIAPPVVFTSKGDQFGTNVTRLSVSGSTSPAYPYRDKEGYAKPFPITTTQASPECKDFSCWEVGSGAFLWSSLDQDMVFNQNASTKYALPGTHTDSFATDKPNWQ